MHTTLGSFEPADQKDILDRYESLKRARMEIKWLTKACAQISTNKTQTKELSAKLLC